MQALHINQTPSQDTVPGVHLSLGGVGDNLLAVLVVADARRGSTVAAANARADTDNLAVNGARDAVLQLQVHLGDGVLRKDGGIRDVTNGSRLDHVADGEALDGLVLGGASRAVGASDGLDVAAALLVAAAGELLAGCSRLVVQRLPRGSVVSTRPARCLWKLNPTHRRL
jgi:hypothetical protein